MAFSRARAAAMARIKRSLEEIANKSDSDDDDYSDHPVRNSRRSASKSKSRKKNRPTKKRAKTIQSALFAGRSKETLRPSWK